MSKKPGVFLSYSHKDKQRAVALEQAMMELGVRVWRDERSISAGARWSAAIETSIRQSRGVVVFLSPASEASEWVTYEYAFATGAGIPVVAVALQGTGIPDPVRQFQTVRYKTAGETAERVRKGLRAQSRTIGRVRASSPSLVAKFQEVNGEIRRVSGGKTPSLRMDLWIENAPRHTRRVHFEIPDQAFKNRKWTISRKSHTTDPFREFLTDDMNSYGDVELWATGTGHGDERWSTSSTLYEALVRYYSSHPTTIEISRALAQIRKN